MPPLCHEVLTEVRLLLDNECCSSRSEVLRRHLEHCDSCRTEYGTAERFKELVARTCGGEQAPHSLRNRLWSAIWGVSTGRLR